MIFFICVVADNAVEAASAAAAIAISAAIIQPFYSDTGFPARLCIGSIALICLRAFLVWYHVQMQY